MCFSQKSDLFFRFEKLGVRRKSPVSPAAFSTPFHAGGPHRDAARAPAQAHSRSSRPGEALHVEPAQGRRQDRRLGRRFRERKTSNHRAGSGFVRSRAQPPRRRRPGRCEVRPARRDLSPDRGAKTRPRGTSVPSFRTRRRFTLARRTPRAHIPSPAFAPFFPGAARTRLPDFSEPPPPSRAGPTSGRTSRALRPSIVSSSWSLAPSPSSATVSPPPTPARRTRRRCSNAPTRSWSSSATRSARATSARRSRARARRTPSPRPGPSA